MHQLWVLWGWLEGVEWHPLQHCFCAAVLSVFHFPITNYWSFKVNFSLIPWSLQDELHCVVCACGRALVWGGEACRGAQGITNLIIIAYPKLEGIHQDTGVQLLAVPRNMRDLWRCVMLFSLRWVDCDCLLLSLIKLQGRRSPLPCSPFQGCTTFYFPCSFLIWTFQGTASSSASCYKDNSHAG